MTRQEIKAWAKEKIKGNMWAVLGAILIANLVGNITTAVTVENEFAAFTLSIAGGILAFFMEIGLIRYMTNFINSKETSFDMLFSKFKDWKQVIITYLHQFAMVFLFTLLLVIPGIIKGYGYALVSYILADNSDIDSKEALRLSEEMMKGHKWELFVFGLSFIGWHLLAILTLGILEIWIMPYQQTATTKFLLDIKENYKPSASVTDKTAEVI